MCDSFAKLRRKLQKLSKYNLLFLDETALRLNTAPTSTIVAPGETNYVIVEDTTAYALRYDMIACCTADRVFPPRIFNVTDRMLAKSKGINREMLLHYIHDLLAQACGALDRYPLILVLDRARIHLG